MTLQTIHKVCIITAYSTCVVKNQLLLHNRFTAIYVLHIVFLYIQINSCKSVNPQHSN